MGAYLGKDMGRYNLTSAEIRAWNALAAAAQNLQAAQRRAARKRQSKAKVAGRPGHANPPAEQGAGL